MARPACLIRHHGKVRWIRDPHKSKLHPRRSARLLRLPFELRDEIYDYLFVTDAPMHLREVDQPPALAMTCRQLFTEVAGACFGKNEFYLDVVLALGVPQEGCYRRSRRQTCGGRSWRQPVVSESEMCKDDDGMTLEQHHRQQSKSATLTPETFAVGSRHWLRMAWDLACFRKLSLNLNVGYNRLAVVHLTAHDTGETLASECLSVAFHARPGLDDALFDSRKSRMAWDTDLLIDERARLTYLGPCIHELLHDLACRSGSGGVALRDVENVTGAIDLANCEYNIQQQLERPRSAPPSSRWTRVVES